MSRAHRYRDTEIYSRAHSPIFPSLHLYHNSFINPSIALSTTQLILQPFCRFTYITAHSPTLLLLHLCRSSFSNPSFASPTSQALHLLHLASRPWKEPLWRVSIPGIYRIPRLCTYVTWRAVHVFNIGEIGLCGVT